MKRLFYLLFGLVLLPALLYAQGSLSPKDINDNLTNNYYTKTVSDSKYATSTDISAKADKTYVDANFATTAENALKQNIADMVDYYTKTAADLLLADKADTGAVALKANTADVYDTAAINLLLADKADTGSVTIVSGALASHTGEVSGAHQGSAITIDSSGFTGNLSLADNTAQKAFAKLDALSGLPATNAITKIYGDSDVDGCETGAVWLVGTNGVTVNRTDNTFEIEIPAVDTNQTVTVTAGEALTAGQVVSLINESGTMKAYNNLTTVSTSPNGSEYVFNSAATSYCSAVALDSSRFLVAYRDSDTYPKAIVGTVTGSTISWGSESNAFENVSASDISACKIATDKVLICYADGTNSKGRMLVLSISTATITNGTPASIVEGCATTYYSTALLETNKVLVCYRDFGNTKGASKIVTISDTTPTPYPDSGTAGTAFNAAATTYISVSTLSSTTVIACYSDAGNSSYGTSQILSISGTTITPGTEYVFSGTTATTYTSVAALSATAAVITYEASGGNAVVATNSNGTLSYGTPATFTSGQFNSTTKIDANHILIAARDGASNGQSIIGTISGTGITLGTAYRYNAAASTYNSVCYLGSNKSAIAYTDGGNSSYGTAVVNQWATSSYASVAGISSGAYSSGSDAVVLISGVSDDQSDLIVGSPYFLQSDFTIGTTPVSLAKYYNSSTATGEIKIGTAKSATELIIGIDYK